MLGLAVLVASVGVADSVNPSTIIPGVWLAIAPHARGIAFYVLGVFCVYLAGGIVLVLGPGPSVIAALHHLRGPVEHAIQAGGGALLLGFAYFLWYSRHATRGESHMPRCHTRASAFALGAGIMAIELPTAFMYFGAISAILAARVSAPTELSLLIVYNAIFVAPLVGILTVCRLAGHRAQDWLVTAEVKIRRVSQLALGCLAGAAGLTLLTIGLVGLLLSG